MFVLVFWNTFHYVNLYLRPRTLKFLRMLVSDSGGGASQARFRCSGSQIEISIMKSVWEHQCKWLLIYNHDDLSDLHIEINFSKKIIFLVDLSSKLASKKRLKEILKEIGNKNEIWNFFHRIRFFDLDVFWYNDWYWKASLGSILNDFNIGLTIFYDLSSFFNKISASCKFSLKSWNSNFFSKNEHRCIDAKFSKTIVRKWKRIPWRCF